MNKTLALLAVLFGLLSSSNAETFSSSTNFVQTLRVGTNEAIFVTTLKSDMGNYAPLTANVSRTNQVQVWPVWSGGGAFAGPMDLQFRGANVIMEFQRVRTTNAFTASFKTSSWHTVDVPAGKTIHIATDASWYVINDKFNLDNTRMILSNSITSVDAAEAFGSFTGPLSIKFAPGRSSGTQSTDGYVTYYFTDEFEQLPQVGATVVPAGRGMLAIEKSQDLRHWRTVFFAPVGSDQSGFYRLNFSK